MRNRSTKAQKIRWLLANQNVWLGFPRSGRDSLRDLVGHLDEKKLIFERMVRARLYARNADWKHADIVGLISAARKQRREAAAKETGL